MHDSLEVKVPAALVSQHNVALVAQLAGRMDPFALDATLPASGQQKDPEQRSTDLGPSTVPSIIYSLPEQCSTPDYSIAQPLVATADVKEKEGNLPPVAIVGTVKEEPFWDSTSPQEFVHFFHPPTSDSSMIPATPANFKAPIPEEKEHDGWCLRPWESYRPCITPVYTYKSNVHEKLAKRRRELTRVRCPEQDHTGIENVPQTNNNSDKSLLRDSFPDYAGRDSEEPKLKMARGSNGGWVASCSSEE